jgi:hypothetical protein
MDEIIQQLKTTEDITRNIEQITSELKICEIKITKIFLNNSEDIIKNILIINEILNDFEQANIRITLLRNLFKKLNMISTNDILILQKIIKIKNYILLKEKMIYITYIYNLYDELTVLLKLDQSKNKLRIIDIISQLESYFKKNQLKCLTTIHEKYIALLKNYHILPK